MVRYRLIERKNFETGEDKYYIQGHYIFLWGLFDFWHTFINMYNITDIFMGKRLVERLNSGKELTEDVEV